MTTPPFQPQPCDAGSGAGGADVENLVLCDVDAEGNIVGAALAVYEYDATGTAVGPPTFVDPVTGAPYVPQGTLMVCPEGSVSEFILCDIQPDESAVQFIRKLIQGPNGDVRQVVDLTLDGGAYSPTGTVRTCEPTGICTPDPGQNLDGSCVTPGEPVDQTVTEQDADIEDDPNADNLCGGGTWGTSPISQPPPFPIEEPSRTSSFDDPDVQVHGNAHLTGGVEDADGFGWLRLVDNNFSNGPSGAVIFNTAFPSTEDVVLFFDYAMFDSGGATQGLGDGFTFFLLDGTGPAPTYPAGTGSGGGMGYSCNLGAGSPGIQDGYIGVGFDLFGNFADPSHGTGGPGRTPNSITVRGAGDGAMCGGGAYPHILTQPVSPNLIGPHPRSNPVSVRATLRSDGGSTFLTVDVDWKDGAGYVTEIDRLDITVAAGPLPPQLRLGFAGATGGALANIDLRDIRTLAGGRQAWRALPVTTGEPIPPCATNLRVTADVDVTFTSDSQNPQDVDPDPEARLWIVNAVTGQVLDTDEVGSLPSQIGDVHHLEVGATIPPADLPNIRVYVGADRRDAAGSYGSVWENMEVGVVALGCPATKIRTVPISSPCPIDVRVIGGSSDGTPTPVTVVNTAATVAFAPICATVDGAQVQAFRHEVRDTDGNVTVEFLGVDGAVITPSTWSPGDCDCVPLVLGEVCVASTDFPGQVLPAVAVQACDGTVAHLNTATGVPWTGTVTVVVCPPPNQTWEELLCDQGNGGAQFRRIYNLTPLGSVVFYDEDMDTNAYVVVGPAGACTGCDPVATTGLCLADGTPIAVIMRRDCATDTVSQDGWINLTTGAFTAGQPPVGTVACGSSQSIQVSGTFCSVDDTTGDVLALILIEYTYAADGSIESVRLVDATTGATYVVPAGATVTTCPTGTEQPEQDLEVLCDVNAGVSTPFIRDYRRDETGAIVAFSNYTLAGAAYTPTGTVGLCSAGGDSETVILCDSSTTPVRFLRTYTYTAAGAVAGFTDTTLAGAPFVPVGAVGVCSSCCPTILSSGCTNTGSGRYVAIRLETGTIELVDAVTGAAILAANVVSCPGDAIFTLSAEGRLLTASQVWTPGADVVGTLTGLTFTVLTGTASYLDASGTAVGPLPAGFTASWNLSDDGNVLTPVQSITAAAASTVHVGWTRR